MARTTKDPKGGPVSIRFTEGLLARLKEAAHEGGRPLTAEITRRLEDSITEEARLVEAFGGWTSWSFLVLVAQAFKILRDHTGHAWHGDRFTFEHAKNAIAQIMYFFRPPGPDAVPKDLPYFKALRVEGVRLEGPAASPRVYPFGFEAGNLALSHFRTEYYHMRYPEAPRAPYTPEDLEALQQDPRRHLRRRGIVHSQPNVRLMQKLAGNLGPIFARAGGGVAGSPYGEWERNFKRNLKHRKGDRHGNR